jgi:hypothetical protein
MGPGVMDPRSGSTACARPCAITNQPSTRTTHNVMAASNADDAGQMRAAAELAAFLHLFSN